MILPYLRATLPYSRPSPNFFALIVGLVAFGVLLRGSLPFDGPPWFFAFVLWGWLVGLVLHEFAHAFVAFAAGDHEVVEKGYLTLDVTRYVHPVLSIVMPIVILIIGGIPLPGGAVWVRPGVMHSPGWRSAVSLAGPAVSGLYGILLMVPVVFDLIPASELNLRAAFVFLAWLQFLTLALNLLPLPGLDGFGGIEPFLSERALEMVEPLRRYTFMILLGIIIAAPSALEPLVRFADFFTTVDGVSGSVWASYGFSQFEFWNW